MDALRENIIQYLCRRFCLLVSTLVAVLIMQFGLPGALHAAPGNPALNIPKCGYIFSAVSADGNWGIIEQSRCPEDDRRVNTEKYIYDFSEHSVAPLSVSTGRVLGMSDNGAQVLYRTGDLVASEAPYAVLDVISGAQQFVLIKDNPVPLDVTISADGDYVLHTYGVVLGGGADYAETEIIEAAFGGTILTLRTKTLDMSGDGDLVAYATRECSSGICSFSLDAQSIADGDILSFPVGGSIHQIEVSDDGVQAYFTVENDGEYALMHADFNAQRVSFVDSMRTSRRRFSASSEGNIVVWFEPDSQQLKVLGSAGDVRHAVDLGVELQTIFSVSERSNLIIFADNEEQTYRYDFQAGILEQIDLSDLMRTVPIAPPLDNFQGQIAYVDSKQTLYLLPNLQSAAIRVDTDTIESNNIVNRTAQPKFSHDGRWLAYCRKSVDSDESGTNYDLYVADSRTLATQRIAKDACTGFDWLPYHHAIVFSREGIWVADIPTQKQIELVSSPSQGFIFAPDVSPDGRWIAYRSASGPTDFWTTSIWDTQAQTASTSFCAGTLNWSPDSAALIHDSNCSLGSGDGKVHIRYASFGWSDEILYDTSANSIHDVKFSNNGQFISFEEYAEEAPAPSRIKIITADGQAWGEAPEQYLANQAWLPSGSNMLVLSDSSSRPTLSIYAPDLGRENVLVEGMVVSAAWSTPYGSTTSRKQADAENALPRFKATTLFGIRTLDRISASMIDPSYSDSTAGTSGVRITADGNELVLYAAEEIGEEFRLYSLTTGDVRVPISEYAPWVQVSADGCCVVWYASPFTISFLDLRKESGREELRPLASSGEQYTYNFPTVSNNGKIIAFRAAGGATGDIQQVWRYDRATGLSQLLSISPAGVPGDAHSYWPTISADGTVVAFVSFATNLGDDPTVGGIYVHDIKKPDGEQLSRIAAHTPSHDIAVSADGRFIAFCSPEDSLVENDVNGEADVFIYDRSSQTFDLVSVSSDGRQGNGDCITTSVSTIDMSDDGRIVSFNSYANNLVDGDMDESLDLFVHDRETGQTISLTTLGEQGDNSADYSVVSMSGDGSVVAFDSNIDGLVPDDYNANTDVFVARLALGKSGDPDEKSATIPSEASEVVGQCRPTTCQPEAVYFGYDLPTRNQPEILSHLGECFVHIPVFYEDIAGGLNTTGFFDKLTNTPVLGNLLEEVPYIGKVLTADKYVAEIMKAQKGQKTWKLSSYEILRDLAGDALAKKALDLVGISIDFSSTQTISPSQQAVIEAFLEEAIGTDISDGDDVLIRWLSDISNLDSWIYADLPHCVGGAGVPYGENIDDNVLCYELGDLVLEFRNAAEFLNEDQGTICETEELLGSQ